MFVSVFPASEFAGFSLAKNQINVDNIHIYQAVSLLAKLAHRICYIAKNKQKYSTAASDT